MTAGREMKKMKTMSILLLQAFFIAAVTVLGTTGATESIITAGRTLVPSSRVVNTRKGSLRGLYLAFDGGDKTGSQQAQLPPVEIFLGVPYASPPVGSLRFMPPVTVSPWRNVRSADRFGPACPQVSPLQGLSNETEALKRMPRGRWEALRKLEPFLMANQSEDCLYLNIYTPYSSKSLTVSACNHQPEREREREDKEEKKKKEERYRNHYQ